MKTAQEVYDQVVAHLRAQKVRSYGNHPNNDDSSTCLYRRVDGDKVLKCAVGCLIADDEYNSKMEGSSLRFLLNNPDQFPLVNFRKEYDEHRNLLIELQMIHDAPEWGWEFDFKAIAKGFGLKYQEP